MTRGAGRPLRFLAVTLGGWVTARVVLLWPAIVPVAAMPPPPAGMADVDAGRWLVAPTMRTPIAPWPLPLRAAAVAAGHRAEASGRAEPLVAIALAAMVRYGDAIATGPFRREPGAIPPPLRPTPIARGRSRLAGSAWGIVRGGGNGTLLGGQLGASQVGARLTYALGEGRRVALSARIATPLRGRGLEAGVGLDWQPTRLPLHLIAEQRVSLDGQRGGPTLLVVGGIPPLRVAAGFALEGYGQAGAIKRAHEDGVEAFGDGAARMTRRLASIGPARLDLGLGVWGAAQRGVRRLDTGPTLGAVVPVAAKALRITVDWRQRIAGNARPDSGPALSIGTDF